MRAPTTTILPFLAVLGLTACGGSSKEPKEPPLPPNDPPTITAPAGVGGSGGLRTFTLPVAGSDTLEFTASDPNGDTLQWTAQVGGGTATATGLTFASPVHGTTFPLTVDPVAEPAAAVLTLLVEDPRGAAASIDVRVVRSGAPGILGVTPDTAFAGQPQVVTITGTALQLGGSVQTAGTFDGVAATDNTIVDDETLVCTTPSSVAAGPTAVGVTNVFGSAQLPDTEFRLLTFPPAWNATDLQLDGGAGTDLHAARDGLRVHAVWLEGQDVAHRASTDGGATWSAPAVLSGGEVATEPQVVVVGSDVTVAWIGGGNSVISRTSHDDGASFAPAETHDSGTAMARPRLAASGARHHLVWQRGTTGLGTARLVAASSANAGDTWTTAELVGDGGGNQHGHEIACDGARAWIAFVDERDGPTIAGIYTARTTNGGLTWEAPQRRSLANTLAGTPRLAHDSGNVWLAWLRNDALEYVASADAGVSWPAVPFELRNGGTDAIAEPALASEGDRLWAIYRLGATNVAVTRVGGIGTAPQHLTISVATDPVGEPCIATSGNYVLTAWRSGSVGGGAARIVTAMSTDLGDNYTAPVGFGDGTAAQELPLLLRDGARLQLFFRDHRTAPPGLFTNRTLL